MDHHPDCQDPDTMNVTPVHVEMRMRTPEDQKILEQLFVNAQPTLAAPGQEPPKPDRLSEIDRLKLENVSLKLLNIGQQFERLSADRAMLSEQFDALRRDCLITYGVDVATTRVDSDGKFGPPIPSMAPSMRKM